MESRDNQQILLLFSSPFLFLTLQEISLKMTLPQLCRRKGQYGLTVQALPYPLGPRLQAVQCGGLRFVVLNWKHIKVSLQHLPQFLHQ